jgi:hypothetical protein
MQEDLIQQRPVFNVFHQNPLLNNNIMVALNPEMAEEIISLVLECCSTADGLENRSEYPHLYGLSDRLQSNLDYSKMQKLQKYHRRNFSSRTNTNVDSFLNRVDGERGLSSV